MNFFRSCEQIRVFYLIQQAHAALFRAADHAMREEQGVTATQSAVLFILARQDGLPISEIAEQLRMGKSSLTALIDRMISLGLVRRERNAEDARVMNIYIENKGAAIVKQVELPVKRINQRLLKPFNDDERRTIERFLRHISQNAHAIIGRDTDRRIVLARREL